MDFANKDTFAKWLPSGESSLSIFPIERGQHVPATNFAFVLNVNKLSGYTSFEIAPGHTLRRAVPEEVERIKRLVKPPAPNESYAPWERKRTKRGSVHSESSAWRYFVVAFRDDPSTIMDLQHVATFSEVDLRIEPIFFSATWGKRPAIEGVLYNPGRLYQCVDTCCRRGGAFLNVSQAQLRSLGKLLGAYQKHDESIVDVKWIASQLVGVQSLPHNSALRFLGLFGLLESLLTHKPNPTDAYQSITRQVTKKINLLNRRFAWRIDYSVFGSLSQESVWKKMYSYRSCVAHGERVEFKGDLQSLGNAQQALELLEATLKAVVRQTLLEPALIADLREC